MKKIGLTILTVIILLSSVTVFGCNTSKKAEIEYNIEASLDGNILSGKMDLYYTNSCENVIKELKFNLYANAYRDGAKYSPIGVGYISKAYIDGLNYGNIEILSVSENGENREIIIAGNDQNILSVSLKNELYPSDSVCVHIEYRITIAKVISRLGINNKTINLANFYPILCAYDTEFYECNYYSIGDPYYSDVADYKVKFTADSEYVVASSGKFESLKTIGEKSTHTFNMHSTRSFALVLSKEFEYISEVVNGTEIKYYFHTDLTPEKHLECAKKSLILFNEKFGEYPYESYSVVQTPFIQGGMEFPGLVMIADDLEGDAYLEVIVHETAHQWWQSVVGNNEIEYGFLDEGLAEYSVVLFYENYPEYNLTRENLIKSAEQTYKIFCSVSDKLFGKVNTVMVRGLDTFKSEYEYVNLAYVKPCIMYDYLRKTVGEQNFFKALKRYYDTYKFKNATPYDLVGTFEKTGTDTNGFFLSFFDGKVII